MKANTQKATMTGFVQKQEYTTANTRPFPSDPFLDIVTFIFSKQHSGVSALIDSSSWFSISYSEFFPFVKFMASGPQHGYSKGDVVLILLPNSIFFPVIFLVILYPGAIASAMYPLSSITDINYNKKNKHLNAMYVLPLLFQKMLKI